ncbi:peptidoglycan DD-metalloendopeptidase family protein [Zavarzinia sp. CC-PAN008]|uniref:M23 family metallopeptidase n=1 Tax=Zavarzinia sp. CC-PAN008 TaxID=3243332 RepID=UPI003F74914B
MARRDGRFRAKAAAHARRPLKAPLLWGSSGLVAGMLLSSALSLPHLDLVRARAPGGESTQGSYGPDDWSRLIRIAAPIANPDPVAAAPMPEPLTGSEPDGTAPAGGPDDHLAAGELALEELAAQDAPPIPEITPDAPNALTTATYSVQSGDSLLKILVGDAAATLDEAHAAIDALKGVCDPNALRMDQEIEVTTGPLPGSTDPAAQPVLLAVAYMTDVDRTVRVTRGADGAFTAGTEQVALTSRPSRVGGTIEDSLFAAARSAGLPAPVLAELIRIYSYDVDFQREVQPGDTFDVYYPEEIGPDGDPVRTGALAYAALTVSGRTIKLYRFTPSDDDTADYFDAQGNSVRKALLRTPIDGARLTSGFGMRRHPILGYSRMHKGVDFGAATGTPILAAGDGTIAFAGRRGAYGNYVQVRHTGEYATAYAHMSRFARGLKAGTRVRQGQVIGYVGSTGRSTGPHLHYEVLVKGAQINPLSVRLQSGRSLSGRQLQAFRAHVREVEAALSRVPLQTAMADGPDGPATR